MWRTILVIGKHEKRLEKDLPPMTRGGEILLYLQDQFDGSQRPAAFEVERVLFDVYSVKQYVYLKEREL
jgi:hypothetical protein